jgi:hypothetical protein
MTFSSMHPPGLFLGVQRHNLITAGELQTADLVAPTRGRLRTVPDPAIAVDKLVGIPLTPTFSIWANRVIGVGIRLAEELHGAG